MGWGEMMGKDEPGRRFPATPQRESCLPGTDIETFKFEYFFNFQQFKHLDTFLKIQQHCSWCLPGTDISI